MIYIFESELPENKLITISLMSIFGIGFFNASKICKKLGFSYNLKLKDLTKPQMYQLITTIELSDVIISNDLKKMRLLINKKLIEIKSYRGLRKLQGLPVRGQRTHTNARSSRRNRNK